LKSQTRRRALYVETSIWFPSPRNQSRGSAACGADAPTDAGYRLDEADAAFEDRFGDLVKSLFSDFERHHRAFEDYRRIIRSDKARFTDQVRSFFFKPNS
jgi:hypothetical protein